MQDILRLLHQQQIEDLEEGSGSGSGGSDEENSDDEELVPGFSMHRALLFATGELTVDDLTPGELEAFQKEALTTEGDVAAEVQAWQPWWTTQAAAELQLSAPGTKCIEEVTPPSSLSSPPIAASEDQQQILPPPPPTTPLPAFSSLTSQPPSPALPLHLLDLLYSYCLTLRLFNGQYSTDILDAISTVLASSSVLGGSHSFSPPSPDDVPSTVLLNCVMHVCSSTEAGRAQVPRSFAIGILSDVAIVLQLGRAVVVTALTDLSRLVDLGLTETRSASINTNKNVEDLNADQIEELQQQQRDCKQMMSLLKQAQRKMLFFLSWVNEVGDAVAPALAMATGMVYEQQRATVVELQGSEETKEILLPTTTGTTTTGGSRGGGDGNGGNDHLILP
jgi:hypothetical protein